MAFGKQEAQSLQCWGYLTYDAPILDHLECVCHIYFWNASSEEQNCYFNYLMQITPQSKTKTN